MKKIIAFSCALLYSCFAQAVEVTISAQQVNQGDSLSLKISDSKPLQKVDLAPLTKDFMLGGQSQSQSSRFINGVGLTTYELGVVLFPIKSGKLEIPALKVGNETTKPLTLTVHPAGTKSATNTTSDNIQLKAEVSDAKPYVGQSLFYTLQLTDGVGILDGEVVPSQTDKINIMPVGSDTQKKDIQNGQVIRTIERTYRIVPESAGKITIPPAVFNGQVEYTQEIGKNKRSLFGMFDTSDVFGNFMVSARPVQIISNPIELDVQPQPADWSGWWLPSTDVQLNVSYQVPPDIQVGDAITGELTLSALDVDANDMPVPKIPAQSQFRLYPEPEERTTQLTSDGHVKGTVKAKFSLVPLQSGAWEIPAVSVPWFKTKNKQKEVARIEAYPLNVRVGENPLPVLAPPQPTTPVQTKDITTSATKKSGFVAGLLWGVGGVLGVMALVGGIIWLIYRRKKVKKQPKKKPIPDFYAFK